LLKKFLAAHIKHYVTGIPGREERVDLGKEVGEINYVFCLRDSIADLRSLKFSAIIYWG
jgi:hypothetical protein